ncbi:MAG: OmpA family protein [Zetaproteobacteria bacterium]|nr:OmpA family protein [Zetaproteobacteria bacterium]
MARRQKKPKAGLPKGNFDLLFLQLMMIMMAFFILLNTMAHIESEKRLKALSSITMTFGIMQGGFNFEDKGKATVAALKMSESQDSIVRTAKAVTELAKKLGGDDAIHAIPLDKESVRVRFEHSILFDSGSTKLSSYGLIAMDNLAPILQEPDVELIMIEGHSDSTQAPGGPMGNWSISAQRALSVFAALRDRGVPVRNMAVAGFADTRPVTPDVHDPEKDRRVELLLKFRTVTSDDVPSAEATQEMLESQASDAEKVAP